MAINKTHFRTIDFIDTTPEKTLVLIGTAHEGPVGVPFMINSDASVFDVLGPCSLAKAYAQAYRAGGTNIVLYRINGRHSTATLSYRDEEGDLIDVLRFTSVSANDVYNSVGKDGSLNNLKVEIDGVSLKIKKTNGTYRHYLLRDYPNAISLADALNVDAAYGLIEFETVALIPEFNMALFNDEAAFTATFSGGSTEDELIIDRSREGDITAIIAVLKQRIKAALFGEDEEDQLQGEPNSILGLLDYAAFGVTDLFYEDDPEVASILGSFCMNKPAYSGHGCLSVMGTTPLYDPTEERVVSKARNLMDLSPLVRFQDPGGIGNGSEVQEVNAVLPLNYVQIVTGDTPTIAQLGALDEPFSLAFAYLGSLVSSNYYTNVTNKSLVGITEMSYEFSKEVIDNLAANGYISIVSSIRRGYVPYLAVTAVGKSSKSSYKKPHYIRIAQQIGRLLNENLDYLVGTNKDGNTKTNVTGRIHELMQNLVDSGVIRGYSLVCEFSNHDTMLNVSVSFTPYSDVESVSSTTILPLGQGVIG